MPLNSVQTNTGAITAVRALTGAADEIANVRTRLSTGRRVAGARDNGAVWAIAQKHRSDVGAISAISGSLQRARSTLDVAMSAGAVISDLLVQMKEKALAGADAGLTQQSRAALSQDFEQLRNQITRVVEGAEFGGVNLIKGGAVDFTVPAGLAQVGALATVIIAGGGGNVGGGNGGGGNGNGGGGNGNGGGNGGGGNGGGNGGGGNGGGGGNTSTATAPAPAPSGTVAAPTGQTKKPPRVPKVKVQEGLAVHLVGSHLQVVAHELNLNGPNLTINATDSLIDADESKFLADELDASIQNTSLALARMGSNLQQVVTQEAFLSRLGAGLLTGVGNLVDADLGKESARLRALQTREQLAIRASAIANGAPKVLLGLFRA